MIADVLVFAESLEKWPARNGRPGGERYQILVLDMTKPRDCALRDMYSYALSEDERRKFEGKLEGKTIKLGITEITNGLRNPIMRGRIIEETEKVK